MIEIRLKETGGQHCEVVIVQRDNGDVSLRFASRTGYGDPTFELDELKRLVAKADAIAGVTK
jgi:ABC-type sulfate transport system substrate-binding protein